MMPFQTALPFFVAATVFLVPGCVDATADFLTAVRDHIEAFMDGDVEGYMAHVPAVFYDAGSGRNISAATMRDIYDDHAAEYRDQFAGLTIGDVLDWDGRRVLDVAETKAGSEGRFLRGFGFKADDRTIGVEPTEGSPLFDGWFGVYRPMDGTWKRVAGD